MGFEAIKVPEKAIIASKYLNNKAVVINRSKRTAVSDGFY